MHSHKSVGYKKERDALEALQGFRLNANKVGSMFGIVVSAIFRFRDE